MKTREKRSKAVPALATPANKKIFFFEGSQADADAEYQRLIDNESIEEPGLYLPTGYLSVSQVNMYLRCAKSYEWRYIKGEKRPPAAAMAEGGVMHKVLELAHNTRKDSNKAAGLDTLLDAYHQHWQAMKATEEIDLIDENESEIFKRDEQFIRLYHSEFLPKIIPEFVELRFFIPLTEFRIPVLGFVDLIDSGEEDKIHTVVDHKVTERTKSAAEVENDMQLTLYTHATGLPKARFDMFVKTKTPKIVSLKTLRRSKDVHWVETIFAEVAKGISLGVFPPCSPADWMCNEKNCGYYSACRGSHK